MATPRKIDPLSDHLIRRTAYLEAFSKGQSRQLSLTLSELERELERQLSSIKLDRVFTMTQMRTALRDVQALYDKSEVDFMAEADEMLQAFVKGDNKALDKILNTNTAPDVSFDRLAVKQAEAVLAAPVQMGAIGGLSYGRWVEKMYADSSLRVEAMLRNIAGRVLIGDDIASIARGLEKNFNLTRTTATTLTRTAIQEAHANLALKTFKENDDLVEGVQYIATLDDRTCPICFPFDGEAFYYTPTGGQKSVNEMPQIPQHANCRCVYIPIVEGFGEKETVKYDEWFEGQGEGTQRDILGASRFEEWKAGNADLGDFAMHGEILTLDELEAALG